VQVPAAKDMSYREPLYVYQHQKGTAGAKRSVKGIVQRKLRWVESGVKRWVMFHYWGAGHYFLILKGHHLVFRIKRFAAT
jgi:hypothetical protein